MEAPRLNQQRDHHGTYRLLKRRGWKEEEGQRRKREKKSEGDMDGPKSNKMVINECGDCGGQVMTAAPARSVDAVPPR
ncbi:hypothetical protein E2C01_062531 [Portunus trituberculatus]|uniref:Uncharacterized protein n=1 Tax=Portunus trituberculatus TaxID=210409 RepID=A0A5B7H6M9_PORTR|nr:hypothetical protein [Portunus trituberculatus]